VEKSSPKIWAPKLIFKKLHKESQRPISKKLTKSDHLELTRSMNTFSAASILNCGVRRKIGLSVEGVMCSLGKKPIRAWSLIRNKKNIVLFERHCHATEKSQAIACARRCRSSRLTGWLTWKEFSKKWMAKEEERHKGLQTPPPNKKRRFGHRGSEQFAVNAAKYFGP
jgi:hypothetical protein